MSKKLSTRLESTLTALFTKEGRSLKNSCIREGEGGEQGREAGIKPRGLRDIYSRGSK